MYAPLLIDFRQKGTFGEPQCENGCARFCSTLDKMADMQRGRVTTFSLFIKLIIVLLWVALLSGKFRLNWFIFTREPDLYIYLPFQSDIFDQSVDSAQWGNQVVTLATSIKIWSFSFISLNKLPPHKKWRGFKSLISILPQYLSIFHISLTTIAE